MESMAASAANRGIAISLVLEPQRGLRGAKKSINVNLRLTTLAEQSFGEAVS